MHNYAIAIVESSEVLNHINLQTETCSMTDFSVNHNYFGVS